MSRRKTPSQEHRGLISELEQLRAAKGLNYTQLAKYLGLSRGQLYRIRNLKNITQDTATERVREHLSQVPERKLPEKALVESREPGRERPGRSRLPDQYTDDVSPTISKALQAKRREFTVDGVNVAPEDYARLKGDVAEARHLLKRYYAGGKYALSKDDFKKINQVFADLGISEHLRSAYLY